MPYGPSGRTTAGAGWHRPASSTQAAASGTRRAWEDTGASRVRGELLRSRTPEGRGRLTFGGPAGRRSQRRRVTRRTTTLRKPSRADIGRILEIARLRDPSFER